jgi:N-acetylneuraminic acid mutarotase
MKNLKHYFSLVFTLLLVQAQAQYNFSSAGLNGVSITNPTSLDFGPDGRLYVAVQTGEIYAYTVQRQSSSNYVVTATETILDIKQIVNHNDNDGSIHNVVKRQVTGLLVDGTATNPIIYVTSSDYRIGGGGGGSDINLDSNSGIISRLSWDGTKWVKIDLVRGLSRSEENHSTNGLQWDKINNILYVAAGGNTNAGSPSNNFAFLNEYALSAAILEIDLGDLDSRPILTDATSGAKYIYDLPTLDDPTRANANGISDPSQAGYNGIDINDPFGGNDGLNQAKWLVNGPVQVYASGFRNAFDVVLTEDGKIYTWDNGANQGWGGHPSNEGAGTATNNWTAGEPGSTGPGPNDAMVNNKDGLHYITGRGYYGGHPNPVRANPLNAGLFTHDHNNGSGGQNGQWRTSFTGNPATTLPVDWPPVDPSLAHPIEGDFQNSGVDDLSLFNITASTNGMAEYRATNFNNQLAGSLLAASFNGNIYLVNRNAAGGINGNSDVSVLATGFGAVPLDVCSQADQDIFPGTIWAATYGSNAITIFEPQDFSQCDGTNSSVLDEDQDGYSNADEIENGTNPCSGSSFPGDNDKSLINGFLVSDLNDPDDDDDGLSDQVDFFALDGQNGLDLDIAFDYPLLNGDPGFGLFGLGFTGFMSNGNDDYLDLFKNEDNSDVEIIAGGAVGLLSFNDVSTGTPFGPANDLNNGFQFGLDVDQNTLAFEIETALVGSVFQGHAQGDQFHGFYIGTGDQDNYLLIGANANQGNPLISIWIEEAGQLTQFDYPVVGLSNAAELSLYLEINPLSQEVQAKIDLGNGLNNLGTPITFPAFLQHIFTSSDALALGVATGKSAGDSSFNATYDYIKANYIPNTLLGNWNYLNTASTCQANAASCPQGRHEAAYVEAGEYFVLLGGREHGSNVNLYNPSTNTWTVGTSPGFSLHHFQAIEHEGLVYVLAGMTGNFPDETPLDKIYIYDPLSDEWHQGPEIPAARRRGSAGAISYQNKFYLVGGIINGHNSGWVPWFDQFDPATNTWTVLSDAPRERDHFHASLQNGKLYAAGGRKTGFNGIFFSTIPEVDVYDFDTQSWATLPNDIPRPMGDGTTVILGNELLVIGGEDTASIASNLTQALDLNSLTWRDLDSLNTGRHGSQALVNNQSIYLPTGSPVQGGGQLLSQEVFSFSNTVSPQVLADTKSKLEGPSIVDFGVLALGQNSQRTIYLKNEIGSQAILLDSVYFSNGQAGVNISVSAGLPLHLSPGDSVALNIDALLSSSYSNNILVASSASNAVLQIPIQAQVIQSQSVLINCGGPAYTASNGDSFGADQYFINGNTYQKPQAISLTDDDDLYHTERYAQSLQYSIPVNTNGNYIVELHFAEIYGPNFLTGARTFDLSLEGQVVKNALDIFDTVGGAGALVLSYPIEVTDGSIEFSLDALTDNAKLSAIAIRPSQASLIFDPASHHFQSTALNTSDSVSLSLRNTGNALISIDSVQMTGAQSSEFGFDLNNITALPAAYNGAISIYFNPSQNTPVVRNAQMQIFYNGDLIPAILNLSGEAGCEIAGLSCDDSDATTINDTTDGNCNCHGTVVSAPSFSLHINAGGQAYTAADGSVFTADQYFVNGSSAGNLQSISGTNDSVLYSSERWNQQLAYEIPVPSAGSYEVTLYFAEIWSGAFAPNKRVFDMWLEDSLILDDLDIYATQGAKTAYSLKRIITVNDGILNLSSLASINNTKLSAISVINATNTPPPGPISPFLSETSLSFVNAAGTGVDSALVWLQNPGLTTYNIDSLVLGGSTPSDFQSAFSTNVLLAQDSLPLWVYFSPSAAAINSSAQLEVYLPGIAPLSLALAATFSCPAIGTACDDGNPLTINDQEDGNCNCQGSIVNPPNQFSLNINCGGAQYVSGASGKTYVADQNFYGGVTFSSTGTVQNTNDQTLFQSARMGKNMSYVIPIPAPDVYHITLHFAEIQKYLFGSGNRVFDLIIEGQLIADDLDIYNIAGGLEAYSLSFTIPVSDGELNINTAASINNSLISAIEVRSGIATPPPPADLSPYLSAETVSMTAYLGSNDSARFYIINPDSIAHTFNSLDSLGFTPNIISTSLNAAAVIAAGDSLAVDLYFNAGMASLGGTNGSFTYYLSGDTLEQQISLNSLCLTAGTTCNDGDSTTTNDIEDGNCNCQGTSILAPNLFSLNINCGGLDYTGSTGKTFVADQYFVGGFSLSSTKSIANTSEEVLYQDYRIGRFMGYSIPVPTSSVYQVTLHFSELQNYLMTANARVFDVSLEGQVVLSNLDVYTSAGGGATAYTQSFTVSINDGELDINTAASSQNSVLSAIEITEIGSAKNASSISRSEDNHSDIQFDVYPNPLQSNCSLSLALNSDVSAQVDIRNIQGAAIYERKLEAGSIIHEIDDLDLNPGVYLVQVVQAGKWQQKKLIVQ